MTTFEHLLAVKLENEFGENSDGVKNRLRQLGITKSAALRCGLTTINLNNQKISFSDDEMHKLHKIVKETSASSYIERSVTPKSTGPKLKRWASFDNSGIVSRWMGSPRHFVDADGKDVPAY